MSLSTKKSKIRRF